MNDRTNTPQPGQSASPYLSGGYTEALDGRLIETSTGRPATSGGDPLYKGPGGRVQYERPDSNGSGSNS